jgi:putative FmdB family regulatory protein
VPTYDLTCTSCEHQFEAFRQGFLRDDDRVCPECGAEGAAQRFTGFITARPARETTTTVVGAGGGGCCGGACGCG